MEVFESFAGRSISMEDLISPGKYQPCMMKRCPSVDSVVSIQQHHFRHNAHKGFAATHLENFTQHNFSSAYLHSEEDVLISTFEACDIKKTGWVSPVKIVEFLQEVTGQSGNDGPLKGLHAYLDPEELGIAISQDAFLSIMKGWIKECRHDILFFFPGGLKLSSNLRG
ncbi:inositol 1,4,5-triphosphate receptor associated 2-like [Erpetoichthys calabaricus]|uniref:inositol 1,4,5-triphosphate receptor associated 2-like n=1 Tax=Erpetoichthys calabaricus TaxID=27687 RepID=UPI0022347529|nr:inositol 1,4,5-triphosphate receptor associated 2-like [Erpetoichthys calabaricus]